SLLRRHRPGIRVRGGSVFSTGPPLARGRSLSGGLSPMSSPPLPGEGNGSLEALHARFLALVPRIALHARLSFPHVQCPGKKADAIAETLAIAWHWYVRLVERGKDPAQFVTTFAF